MLLEILNNFLSQEPFQIGQEYRVELSTTLSLKYKEGWFSLFETGKAIASKEFYYIASKPYFPKKWKHSQLKEAYSKAYYNRLGEAIACTSREDLIERVVETLGTMGYVIK